MSVSASKHRQQEREKHAIYKANESSDKPKFYVLDMFPYPSGAGLHVWHPKWYVATDVLARAKMLQWYNVLHPMGRDAFWLPAEQYAIKNKVNPTVSTAANVAGFKKQLQNMWFTYDWEREVNTTDPEFYKWTQWTFIKLYEHYYDTTVKKAKPINELPLPKWLSDEDKQQYINNHRLAYVDYKPILRSVDLQTAIAQEDLDENGNCERTGWPVERRPMRQRVIRITDYADRLLDWLDELVERPDSVKQMQRHWIGKAEGTEFTMQIQWYNDTIGIYTTRIDTVYGMSYVALAPEHPLLSKITTAEQTKVVEKYIKQTKNKGELQRTDLNKDKTGVFTGAYAINPFNQQPVPIRVADYVLGGYGTWAVMAVPAHDERDFAFAKKYDLPIVQSIQTKQTNKKHEATTEKWVLVQSWEYNSMTSDEAIAAMQSRLQSQWIGGKKTQYKLQDRVFSRQRYRGEPIPMIHTADGIKAINESELPLKLPEVEHYEPTGTEEGPLANITDWVNTPKGKRETNTMPQRAGSSRYRLRYMDPKNPKNLVDPAKEKYRWQVDVYVGGMEHATRHLIYARFWHKFLYDIGVVSTSEPFKKLYGVWLVLAEDGRKMSKRRWNVVNPDDVIAQYGADAFRTYEMFMWPFENEVARSTAWVKGVKKFLDKVEKLSNKLSSWEITKNQWLLHKTIKKVTEDIENFRFNTAISQLMILVNALSDQDNIDNQTMEILTLLISPFAPHLAETLREKLGNEFSLFTKGTRPSYDEKLLVDDTVNIAVQFNGKVRGTIQIVPNATQDEVMAIIKSDTLLASRIESEPKKIIYITGKIINIIL